MHLFVNALLALNLLLLSYQKLEANAVLPLFDFFEIESKNSKLVPLNELTAPDFDFGVVDPTCNNNNSGKLTVVHFDLPLSTYTYVWSNGATSQTINNLSAGSYTVTVTNTISNINTVKSITIYQASSKPLINVKCADEILIVYNLGADTRCVNNNGRVFRVGNLLDNYYKAYGCPSASGMNPWPDWLKMKSGTLTEYANGSARLEMTIFSECDTTLRFTVHAKLSNKINSSGADPLTNDQCTAIPINDNNWLYYREVYGYLIGLNQLNGGVIYFDTFNGNDFPAQMGYGGNGTSQFVQYGSESWNNGYIVSSPTTGLPFVLKAGVNRRLDWRFAFNGPLLNTDPYCNAACNSETTTLQSNGFSPYNVTYLWSTGNSTQNITVNPAITTTYTVSVTDIHGCTATETFTMNVSSTIPTITSTVPASRCGTGSVVLSATPSSGTVRWFSDAAGGTPLHTGLFFTTPSINTSTTYYAEAIDAGCSSLSRTAVVATVNGLPTANINGIVNICQGSTTVLVASGGNSYLWQNGSTQSSIVVATQDSYMVTVTNNLGCTSSASAFVNVYNNPSISLDYNGHPCLVDESQLSVVINSGLAPFTYSWTGPSGFTSNTSPISITNSGNYYVTVTDANSCSSVINGFVYERYDPFIASISTSVCVGESVELSASSPTAISYLWSSNTGNATSATVTVLPGSPSTQYHVTITNNVGCTAVPSVTITANQAPTVSITGPTAICVGQQSTLSPSTGGVWTSNNPSVATVSSSGIVTGVGSGIAAFTFTDNTTGCTSFPTPSVTIHPKPSAVITGPTNICVGSTSQITPNVNGTWISSNPAVATITNTGLITGVSVGSATFTYTNSTTGCVSDASASITVSQPTGITLSGPNTVCIQSNITIAPSVNGGTWASSNSSIAYVNDFGIVVGLNPGSVTISYTYQAGPCIESVNKVITVLDRPVVNIIGESILCTGETTNLSPSTGGTWTSSAPTVASVTNDGLVTALSDGTVYFTFTSTATGCTSPSTGIVTVNAKPIVNIGGNAAICVGGQTFFTPGSGGSWTSSNPTVATINNFGIVTGLKQGTARFVFLSSNGCVSDSTSLITVGSKPSLTIDYNGSVCLNDNSTLGINVANGTAPFTYAWTGPAGFTNNTQSFSVTANGTYNVTVTDTYGCTANTNAFINQRYEPSVLGASSTVCEGQTRNLQVSASNATSFIWSANAANATTQSVTVLPVVPSSTYTVTVTNSLGCTASVSATVNVTPKPIVTLTGSSAICIGATTTFLPSSGGNWVSNNPSVATIANNGIVTAVAEGTATFVFTDFNGCASNATQAVTVNPRPLISVLGSNVLCQGNTVNLSPNSGGIWTSSNNSIATVTNSGVVTGINQGTATFLFTNTATGCVSNNNLTITVLNKPAVFINGDDNICVGANTQLHPSSGGSWVSNNPSIATVANNGLVTGVSGGSVSFTFIEGSSGCTSLPTLPITVHNRPTISLTGSNSLCIGQTTSFTPSTGGFWVSSNPTVAMISSSGVVTANVAGTATFIFTELTNYCSSLASTPITVNPRPMVTISGDNKICIGQTTQLSPASGGTWISNHPAIASVNNSGVVTAIAPGIATFRFTDGITGCVSNNTLGVTVNAFPTVVLEGLGHICVNGTTAVSPVAGGIWTSSNPTIASVNNAGLVTGLSPGSTALTFTETSTGCAASLPSSIIVNPAPTITLNGPDSICIGGTTNMLPSTGGMWVSLHPSIASISSSGLITGLSNGVARFYFVDNATGCASNPSVNITINATPIILPSNLSICQGGTTTLLTSGSGTWISSNPAIATINNSGLVNGVAPGFARFIFTDQQTGCKSDSSDFVQVLAAPSIFLGGPSSVCIGNTTQLSPTVGGVWNSLNPTIATINNAGLVTGMSQGTASFSFTQTSTNCTSNSTISINILPLPTIEIVGNSEICIGQNTALSPSSGGTWLALNPTIATISSAGVATGLTQGLANFRFTSSTTGCAANTPIPVKVNGKPVVSVQGSDEICIGIQTQLSPSSGGTWISENPSIATVNNDGVVTGVSNGSTRFIFTHSATNCTSEFTEPILVNNPKPINNLGSDMICLGYKTQLSTGYAGVWQSSDTHVIVVNATGEVTSVAPGKASISFTETATGCVTTLPADGIKVVNCLDPDINVTFVNYPVSGSVATNDDIPGLAVYGTPLIGARPPGSNQTITLQSDGSYTFTGDRIGVYEYSVPVCMDAITTPCPYSLLSISVVDQYDHHTTIVANTDFATTYKLGDATVGQQISIPISANDVCINDHLNSLNLSTITFPNATTKGVISNAAGIASYTPNPSVTGQETIIYTVCSQQNASNCISAKQILTINAPNASNSVVGVDDFKVGMKGQTIIGNALVNDSDPEGDAIAVVPQGNAGAPIVLPAGSFFILANGNYVFTPLPSFIGPVDIPYTICDNNVAPFCTNATIHLLILPHQRIYAKVYLEGALMRSGNATGPNGKPLMRDDLRNSPFTGLNYIPRKDPYKIPTQFTNLASKFPHYGAGLTNEYLTIPDSVGIFSVEGHNAIVDWVFVELRSKSNYNMVLATRSGLLQRDGDIVDITGESGLEFPGIRKDSVYVVVKHRNHFGVMSQRVAVKDVVDFTSVTTPIFDFGTTLNNGFNYTGLAQKNKVIQGYNALWAGDFDSNGRVKFTNPNDDQNILYFEVLAYPLNISNTSNYNFVHGYLQSDYDLNSKSKYDNPNDDKNFLFSQILTYPLNYELLSNFNFMIQQVPPISGSE